MKWGVEVEVRCGRLEVSWKPTVVADVKATEECLFRIVICCSTIVVTKWEAVPDTLGDEFMILAVSTRDSRCVVFTFLVIGLCKFDCCLLCVVC